MRIRSRAYECRKPNLSNWRHESGMIAPVARAHIDTQDEHSSDRYPSSSTALKDPDGGASCF
jgi:hypothetical protein